VRILLLTTLAVLAWLTAAGGTATGAVVQGGERITAFVIRADVRADGVVAVTETIEYDFGGAQRHGIERELVLREPADDERDRVYELGQVAVTSPTGAPSEVQLVDGDAGTTIRIGDPDRTVTGRQTYELAYTLTGLMNAFDDHDELFWEATGTGWRVPLSDVTVTVTTPGDLRRTACYAGDPSSRSPCGSAVADDSAATFAQSTLAPGEGLTVVVGVDKGVVTVPPPVLDDARRGPWDSPPSVLSYVVAGLAVVGAGVGGGLLWLRRGRDRMYVGLPPGLTPAPGQPAVETDVPVSGTPEPAVAFTPPAVTPGMAGVLLTERTSPTQVSATIVDLAVRGYLRIDERPGRDWELVWLGTPRQGDRLAPYEQLLMDTLFEGRASVLLSSLNTTYSASFRLVTRSLADAVNQAGWFRRPVGAVASPGSSRLLRIAIAVVAVPILFGGSGTLLAVLGAGWSILVVVFGLIVAAVIGVFVWRAMPARTAAGRAVWAQTVGFRRYLATAEAEQLRHEEAAAVFSRYLPLAMVFGLTKRWAAVFAALAAAQGTVAAVGWYTGDPGSLGPSLDDFGSRSGSVLTSVPPSSASGSSGFSSSGSVGGGSSGGGGGSW
jgi:uncharacterized membrane protein YgcG